ncbi:MAG: TonB-dependent receptor [Pseudomonadota bacterium]
MVSIRGWGNGARVTRARTIVAATILAAAAIFVVMAAPGLAQQPATPSETGRDPISFDIPQQELNAALLDFADRAGLQLVYDVGLVRGLRNAPLKGEFTAQQGLSRLLAGTGLSFGFSGANTVTLRQALANGDGPMRLRDITVTARRTEELVQDVPGSVLAIPAEEIERSNITSIQGVKQRSPNLNIAETGERVFTDISIRGIADITGGQATGSTVGIYIDEVIVNPTGSTVAVDPNLLDLERVEVLYGPQGTAFGRGTIGGAINYVTRKPTEDFEATIDAEVGSNPDGLVRTILNGSLSGDRTLMARLVAFGQYDDGFIDTPNIGGSIDSQDYGARLSLRSQPTDRLTLDLGGSFDRTKYRAPNYATLDSVQGDGDLELLINTDGDSRVDRGLVNFRGTYDFDAGTMISNTAYVRTKYVSDGDGDYTEIDGLFQNSDFKTESISQELRFDSETFVVPLLRETGVLAGVNASWAENELGGSILNLSNSPFGPPGSSIPFGFKNEVFDVGIFGEFRFRPVQKLELAAGGRFTYNEVEISQAGFESERATFINFSPKGSARYDWTEDFSTYVLISTGFKSGGFNALGTGPFSGEKFDNETAINYDGGFKSSWFDDRLFVNTSAFALFYNDIQVSSLLDFGTGTPARIVQNAASARSVGTELEIVALPFDGLQLNLGYGFADAKFTDFPNAPGGDATGEQLPNAPKHTLSLVGDYAYPVFKEFGDAFVRAEYSYTSSFSDQPDVGANVFKAYDILNLRVGIRAERFEIEAFVENLLNEKYANGSTVGGTFAQIFGVSEPFEVGATRRFGARAKIQF